MQQGSLLFYSAAPGIPDALPELSRVSVVFLDTETTGLKWWDGDLPIGIAVGWYGNAGAWHSRYLPFGHASGNLEEEIVLRWAKRELRGKLLIGQNAKFDNHMLYEWGVDLEAQGCRWEDVSHLAALLDDLRAKPLPGRPPRGFHLDDLARDYVGKEAQKLKITPSGQAIDPRRMAHYPASEIAPYAKKDVELTAQIYNALRPSVTEQGLDATLALESRCIYPTCEMERNPSPLDLSLLVKWEEETQAKVQRYFWEIHKETGIKFAASTKNWRALFKHCGIPNPAVLTEGGEPSFTAETTEAHLDHPLILTAIRMKNVESLRSKFILKYIHGSTKGAIYTSFHQLRGDDGGTISGRYSSSGYNIDGEQIGANLQQVFSGGKKNKNIADAIGDRYEIKKLFIPDRGKLYVSADAAQIEYRILTHYTQAPEVVEAYRKDPRVSYHKIVMKMVQEVQPDIVYDALKVVNFSCVYGAGAATLSKTLGISLYETELFLEKYHQRFPEPKQLLNKAKRVATERGYVHTLLGRRARFPRDLVNAGWINARKALNAIIQGGAADEMKRKLCEAYEERKALGLTLRLTVHDELCGDVPDQQSADRLEELLNRQTGRYSIPILWDVATGPNWQDAKKEAKS